MSPMNEHDTNDTGAPGPAPDEQDTGGVGALVARIAGRETVVSEGVGGGTAPSRADFGSLAKALATSARRAGRASVLGGGWLVDLMLDTAPRIPVRSLETLQAQHPGLPADDLAQALVSGAAKATGAVGAAGGALAAVEYAAAPTLLTTPVQIAAETLLVAAIEVKLISELHEVYGVGVPGSTRQRMQAYLMSWTERRGIDPLSPGAVWFTVGAAAKRSLRKRLLRRAGRNLSTLGPMMSGAVAGSVVNLRETRRLGEQIRDDLRAGTLRT
jgi:hypothetical protein